jgi:MFS family permease
MTIDLEATAHSQLTGAASLRRPLAFAISCFLVWGFAYGLLDVLNKHFQETLHVGKARSSWLQIAYFGAYLLMSVPAGWLLRARGYKPSQRMRRAFHTLSAPCSYWPQACAVWRPPPTRMSMYWAHPSTLLNV